MLFMIGIQLSEKYMTRLPFLWLSQYWKDTMEQYLLTGKQAVARVTR